MMQIALANLRRAGTGDFARRLVAGVRRLLSETSRSKAEAIHDLSPRMLRDLGLEGTPTRQARRFVDAEAQFGMFR